MEKYITSQFYRNPKVVKRKMKLKDYKVYYVNVKVDGIPYRIVTDGHHAYEASIRNGAKPEFIHSSVTQREVDDKPEYFLSEFLENESDWTYLGTSKRVWPDCYRRSSTSKDSCSKNFFPEYDPYEESRKLMNEAFEKAASRKSKK